MAFNSFSYYLFLPLVIGVYFALPAKWRNGFLLACSYFFYMCWKPEYALLMLGSTAITYVCALCMDKQLLGRRRFWLAAGFVVNISILFFFKYFNFFAFTITELLTKAGLAITAPSLQVLLPVGISFYIFQALGYTVDVYRKDIPAERSFLDYALFVSFFPQLVAGPIERSVNLLPQLKQHRSFDFQRIQNSLPLFFWGLCKKIVVADTMTQIVNPIFDAPPGAVSGLLYALAAVAFAVQIYCDFSAYSDIARASAAMLGITLMQNFDAPYFSTSIKEFWRRWHISLSTWFKDYLYFPLGGNRRGRPRVYVNLMIIFIVSGLWHGAALTFVLWGLLHGFFQVLSLLTKPLRGKILKRLPLSPQNPVPNLLRGLFTFTLVTLTFVVFRAQSIEQALFVVKSIALLPFNGTWQWDLSILPLSGLQLLVVLFVTAGVFAAEFWHHKRPLKLRTKPLLRYGLCFALLVIILIFGYYGSGYDPQDFIYFQF